MNSKTADLQTIQTLAIHIQEEASNVEESGGISDSMASFLEQSMALVLEALEAAQEGDGPMVTYLRECSGKGRETLTELRERGYDIAPNEALYEQDKVVKAVLKSQEPAERTRVELILSVGMYAGALNQLHWSARRKNNVIPLEAS